MARPMKRISKRPLLRILGQIEKIRALCDKVENAIWDSVGAPRPKKPRP